MKDEFVLITIVVFVFSIVVAGMITYNGQEDTSIQNTILECNDNLPFLESLEENLYYYHLKEMNEIKLKKTTCDPTYYLELPENRDKLYLTMDYVVKAQDYELDEYDCTEKADLLVELLKELGYNRAKTKFVNIDCNLWEFSEDYTYKDCKSNNGGHLVVSLGNLYLEATSGRVIMPNQYERYGLK